MSGEDIEMLAARVAALEAKIKDGTRDLNTTDLMSFPEVDVGTPPVVPIGGGPDNFAFEELQDGSFKITSGYVWIGREAKAVPEKTFDESGEYRVKIEIVDGSSVEATIEKGSGTEKPNGEISYLPLYVVSDGVVAKDLRYNFCVPVRE